MKKRERKQRFFESLENDSGNWLEEARYRRDNRGWLQKSRGIAILLQQYLREKGMKQKTLAELLGVSAQQVSKILKGKENLTLDTISKLEKVLGITIIEVVGFQAELEIPAFRQYDEISTTRSAKHFKTNAKISNIESQEWTQRSVNDDSSKYRITG